MDTIAKRVGVSKMTVSRVLNNHPYVSEKVRKKILGLMKELKYRPNLSATILSRRSSKTLGLIIQFYNNNVLSTNYLMQVMHGVEQTLDSYGYNLVLFSRIQPKTSHYDDITAWYYSGLVKGFILVAPPADSPLVKKLIKDDVTFVAVSARTGHKNVSYVDADNAAGAYMATEHLIKLGHRHIGYIGGPADSENARERENGYRRAMNDYGIKISTPNILKGDFEQKGGYNGMMKMLRGPNKPSAVFAANDLMAVGAMQAAREKRFRIPKDISIVGFDDIDLAATANPPLTTIHQPSKRLGELAAAYLVNYSKEKETPPIQRVLEVTLVLRESTRKFKG
jgi:DNA-binding LacI/PurR family transcriptional regulator